MFNLDLSILFGFYRVYACYYTNETSLANKTRQNKRLRLIMKSKHTRRLRASETRGVHLHAANALFDEDCFL